MEHYAPLAQIFEQLTTVINTQQTGVFFIATDTNESARLAINTGRITHCSFRRSHGQQALEDLLQINAAKCSFAENSRFPFRDNDHTTHETALQTLGIRLPVAAEAAPAEALSADETEEPVEVQTVTRIYRGKPVQVALKPRDKKGQNVTKGQRIYRGKVIDADV